MSATIRPSAKADHEAIADLLIADAEARSGRDPVLWALAADARARVLAALANAGETPFRQQWLVAEEGGAIVGVAHSILLPVPPIYAGAFGPPGLIMEDCHVAEAAPPGTRDGLLRAAEADLIGAGARILLASGVEGGDWARTYGSHGYEPLTMYFARSGLGAGGPFDGVRGAAEADVPGIVASSAVHREVLRRLHPQFWKPHAEADARFGGWMSRSLTLTDRDMFVAEAGGRVRGYAISQPATPLHFPAAHDISAVGVVDDFFHAEIEDPETLQGQGEQAAALFGAAEAARAKRGGRAVLVVCPAAWMSKRQLLERLGYRNAITWHIRMAG